MAMGSSLLESILLINKYIIISKNDLKRHLIRKYLSNRIYKDLKKRLDTRSV
jgi:hypothetical protein